MNKWLSVELSLLLLVSLVAFAGFVGFSGSNDLSGSSVNDLTGYAVTCGGPSFGTCPQNYQCRQVSQQCVKKKFGRCTRYSPVYGCGYAPQKPTPTPKPIQTPSPPGKDEFVLRCSFFKNGQPVDGTCGVNYRANPIQNNRQLMFNSNCNVKRDKVCSGNIPRWIFSPEDSIEIFASGSGSNGVNCFVGSISSGGLGFNSKIVAMQYRFAIPPFDIASLTDSHNYSAIKSPSNYVYVDFNC